MEVWSRATGPLTRQMGLELLVLLGNPQDSFFDSSLCPWPHLSSHPNNERTSPTGDKCTAFSCFFWFISVFVFNGSLKSWKQPKWQGEARGHHLLAHPRQRPERFPVMAESWWAVASVSHSTLWWEVRWCQIYNLCFKKIKKHRSRAWIIKVILPKRGCEILCNVRTT